MVRKMLKAFKKDTTDKTHFSIDIKNLTTFCYNPPEHNIKNFATLSPLNLFHN